mmetsp:Transcript_13975/g.39893  ORF Transcript_13975/g.39893 Transcript_13975/m.39893 type:complete len:115 (+) Transcript_13975:2-346(+)
MAAGGRGSDTKTDRVQMGLEMGVFESPTLYNNVSKMTVDVDGKPEEVDIDSERGPVVIKPDGLRHFAEEKYHISGYRGFEETRGWLQMSVTEQTILLHRVAKMNRRTKERWGVA